MNPAVAIVAVMRRERSSPACSAALLAIPTAASLGALAIDELVLSGSPGTAGAQPEPIE